MLNKIKFLILFVLIIFVIANCKFKLTGPSDCTPDSTNSDLASAVKTTWDPYVAVHPFMGDQRPHLLKLIQAGTLRGVRLEGLDDSRTQEFARWFQSHGVEVLGLFENEYLREPNVCEILSQHVISNPQITAWEIGNEVNNFVGMEAGEYISIFRKLFYYARQHHPHIAIVSQAPVGNGNGADILRRMIDAGLDRLCYEGLPIVAIHFYSWKSLRLGEFQNQIARLPISTRVWITETNTMPPNWSEQVEYVKKVYPKLKSSLRAERIYWYVFSGERSDFSLVKGLVGGLPIEYSPLMNLLVGNFTTESVINSNVDYEFFSNNELDNSNRPITLPEQRLRRNKKDRRIK